MRQDEKYKRGYFYKKRRNRLHGETIWLYLGYQKVNITRSSQVKNGIRKAHLFIYFNDVSHDKMVIFHNCGMRCYLGYDGGNFIMNPKKEDMTELCKGLDEGEIPFKEDELIRI